ncbi:hypothetical protein BDP81DRAFT_118077 [Colletotrichum phormii]|uniref:Uncharacterized protein n=1 Tax=Colletotrichum phormii TaxID=359342 RepID=A0AAI9ZGJ8_9PEZI|nr:uncharacterized protein BDP81DRAFT_118077 [Colletotrichum phormii]KAK1623857.1 hypothetical protein BDP81DRAFT_118077 [Colletotrichum phormii]
MSWRQRLRLLFSPVATSSAPGLKRVLRYSVKAQAMESLWCTSPRKSECVATSMEGQGVSRPTTSSTDLREVCQNEPGHCQLSHARAAALWHPSDKKKIPMEFWCLQAWHCSDKASLNGPRSLQRPGPEEATDEERILMRLGERPGRSLVREHSMKTRARIRLAILAPISGVSPRTSFHPCR